MGEKRIGDDRERVKRKRSRHRRLTCKHYRGMALHNTTLIPGEPLIALCEAGVNYYEVAEPLTEPDKPPYYGIMRRLPCLPPWEEGETERPGFCALLELPTEEELEAYEREVEEAIRRMSLALHAIIDEVKRRDIPKRGVDARGVLPCPACGTGQLHWRRSGSNGHRWAQCTTKDCVWFME